MALHLLTHSKNMVLCSSNAWCSISNSYDNFEHKLHSKGNFVTMILCNLHDRNLEASFKVQQVYDEIPLPGSRYRYCIMQYLRCFLFCSLLSSSNLHVLIRNLGGWWMYKIQQDVKHSLNISWARLLLRLHRMGYEHKKSKTFTFHLFRLFYLFVHA